MSRYSTFPEHWVADVVAQRGSQRPRRVLAAALATVTVCTICLVASWGLDKQRARAAVLMPLDVSRDVADTYNAGEQDGNGNVEERSNMRKMYSSWERTNRDLSHENRLHNQQDSYFRTGHGAAPIKALGGPTASSKGAAEGDTAWYGYWWNGMHLSSVMHGLEDITGTGGARHRGKERLVDAGINVNGWEPGRSTREVMRDQKSGNDIPKGFWKDDGEPAHVADTELHHPCGSPLRKRPCNQNDVETADTAWSPATGDAGEPLWKDPLP